MPNHALPPRRGRDGALNIHNHKISKDKSPELHLGKIKGILDDWKVSFVFTDSSAFYY